MQKLCVIEEKICRLKRNGLTGRVTVEDEVVGGSGLDAGDLVLVGEGHDAATKGSGGRLALKSQEIGTEASSVRRSHRSSGDRVLEKRIRTHR